MTEEEMCADIEFRLLSIGVSCVRELQCVDGFVDIAVRGGGHIGGIRIAAIECKVKPAWKRALDQVIGRQPYVDEAWVLEPFLRGPSAECLEACRQLGVGLLRYEPEGVWPFSVILSAASGTRVWPTGATRSGYMAARYDEVERHWRRKLKPRAGSAGLIAGMTMRRVVIMDDRLRKRLARQLSLELVTDDKPRRPRPVVVHRTAQVPTATICGVRVPTPAAFEVVMNFMHAPGAPELRDCKRCEEVWRVNRHAYRLRLIREDRKHICEYTWQERDELVKYRQLGETSSVLAG